MSSELLQRLLDNIKESMKSGHKERLGCLRLLHSDIKKVSIDSRIEITDQLVIDVCSKSQKQRQDSLDAFIKGGRQDLVDQATHELEWIRSYLPAQLSASELEELVKTTIASLGASSKKDMGKVMGALAPVTKGRVDGKVLSQTVNALLGA